MEDQPTRRTLNRLGGLDAILGLCQLIELIPITPEGEFIGAGAYASGALASAFTGVYELEGGKNTALGLASTAIAQGVAAFYYGALAATEHQPRHLALAVSSMVTSAVSVARYGLLRRSQSLKERLTPYYELPDASIPPDDLNIYLEKPNIPLVKKDKLLK